LPLLDAMIPAFARGAETGAKPVVRLSTVFVPTGRIMQKWTPKTEGAGFAMSPTLEPLAPFKDQLLVLSGLNIKAADPVGNEPGGVHARPAAAFLTGIHPKPGGAVGISLDQVAAREFGKETQLASLELGLDSPEIASDDGAYSAYYMNTISWRTGTSPLPMEINPRSVFERMFGDSDTTSAAERMRRVQRQRSILDSVTEGVARLANGVGASDRTKLAEYLDAIRDIERRIRVAETSSEKTASTEQEAYERPVGIPTTFAEHAKLMFDLQVVAFQSDLTRVSTFMLAREYSELVYSALGHTEPHHPLTHHRGIPQRMKQAGEVNVYHARLFAQFLEKMRSAREGDGSLLDHSMIIYGAGMGDGDIHNQWNLPIAFFGGAGGRVKGGRHVQSPKKTPFSNLHVTILNLAGIATEKFGLSTGALDLNAAA
jgi:hypothetical protein